MLSGYARPACARDKPVSATTRSCARCIRCCARQRRPTKVRRRIVEGFRRVAQEKRQGNRRPAASQKRIADLAIDLFVGCCVLSRVDMMVRENDPEVESALPHRGNIHAQARRRMSRKCAHGTQRGRPGRGDRRLAHRCRRLPGMWFGAAFARGGVACLSTCSRRSPHRRFQRMRRSVR